MDALISGGSVNQLALIPLESIATNTADGSGRLVKMTGRARRAARTALGAPGFLSVLAAAERLGLKPRSVRYLIEHGRLGSQRLGRMHFIPVSQVEAYRRTRRARARRRQRTAL